MVQTLSLMGLMPQADPQDREHPAQQVAHSISDMDASVSTYLFPEGRFRSLSLCRDLVKGVAISLQDRR